MPALGHSGEMGILDDLSSWPVIRQARADRLGLAASVRSPVTRARRARVEGATVTRSVCPYCAVGCGQLVHVREGKVVQIEGDPDSPISRGRLCPKGSASKSLVTSPLRERKVLYRRPYGDSWEHLPLDRAMDMIADRVIAARDAGWEECDAAGRKLRRTLGLANLGGATLDNEENYLIKKLMTALGVVQVENQARI
jgi:formate dehydrogenase major subunit